MAVSIDNAGNIAVDGGDQVSFDLTLDEDAVNADNWDDAIAVFEYEALGVIKTMRSDDGDPQVVKVSSDPTVVRITLLEEDTSTDLVGQCRCVLIDPVEDERTTHRIVTNKAGRRIFRVVGNPTSGVPFSPTITPIPDAAVLEAILAAFDDLTLIGSFAASTTIQGEL